MILSDKEEVCFLGAGNIAEAWMERLISSGTAFSLESQPPFKRYEEVLEVLS